MSTQESEKIVAMAGSGERPPPIVAENEAALDEEAAQIAIRGLWSKRALYIAFTW